MNIKELRKLLGQEIIVNDLFFLKKVGNINKLSYIGHIALKFSNSNNYQEAINNTLGENKVFIDREKRRFKKNELVLLFALKNRRQRKMHE